MGISVRADDAMSGEKLISAAAEVAAHDFLIDSDTPGIQLRVRRKWFAGAADFGARETIIMMHGATFSTGSLFDVKLEGVSFMDYLASQGYDVYAVDVRGYGDSTLPTEMDEPPTKNVPLVRTDVAVRDFSSAVDFVLRTRGLENLNVIGMSWGGSVTGAYACKNADKVRKISLIAPQWIRNTPSRMDDGGELGAYRIVNVAAIKDRWLGGVPESKRATFLPEGWFEQWAAATIATETADDVRRNKSIRATNGVVQDTREIWAAGKPIYDPSDIAVPVLLIHGEWDIDVTIAQAQAYFLKLTRAPYRRWVEIGEATHMVALERNRFQVYEAIVHFFAENSSNWKEPRGVASSTRAL